VAIRPGIQNTSNRPASKSPPQDHSQDPDKADNYGDSDSEDEAASTRLTGHARYEGKSSDAGLIHATVQVKQEYDHDYHPHLGKEPDLPEVSAAFLNLFA
jgi:hypothetical protein